jgi:transposase InsO family protein
MKLHGNARTCPHSRRLMVWRVEQEGWTLAAAAEAAGVSVRTVSKWLARYRAEDEDGLLDGSSAPGSIPHRTAEERVQAIAALRRLRLTAAEIAEVLAMPLSTVSAILSRIGLGRRSRLEPPEPPEPLPAPASRRAAPRGRQEAGPHRPARPPRQRQPSHAQPRRWLGVRARLCRRRHPARLRRGARRRESNHRGRLPAPRRRPLPRPRDPRRAGHDRQRPCYGAVIHALACKTLRIKHLRTRPYRPRTNGKAERFIRTLLGGWAYGAIYGSSEEHRLALTGWLDFYNHRRPHGSLSHQPPLTRLQALRRNNLAGCYS